MHSIGRASEKLVFSTQVTWFVRSRKNVSIQFRLSKVFDYLIENGSQTSSASTEVVQPMAAYTGAIEAIYSAATIGTVAKNCDNDSVGPFHAELKQVHVSWLNNLCQSASTEMS
jgi:hypothetical protein